jgi:hypothetical protein
MHLGFDNIDRPGATVAPIVWLAGIAAQVMDGRQRSDHGVEDALWDFTATTIEYRRGGHQVTDIAHERQAATVEAQPVAVGIAVMPVGVQVASYRFAVLGERGAKRALNQTQPVAVRV